MLSTQTTSVKIMGRGNLSIKVAKIPISCLGSGASRSSDHLQDSEGFDTSFDSAQDRLRGRPRIEHLDGLILELTREGKGVKAVARSLRNQGYKISYLTVSRRLSEIRAQELLC